MQWESPEAKVQNLNHLKALHNQMGWRLLLNEHVQIEKDGEKIIVAGVENWSASSRFPKHGKLHQALNGIHETFTVLLLSHDPSHWEAEVLNHPAKIDVMFAGHTHGMQFGIEIFNFKWSPVKYFYKQWAGLYENNGSYLYVNRGFGVIGYPGRWYITRNNFVYIRCERSVIPMHKSIQNHYSKLIADYDKLLQTVNVLPAEIIYQPMQENKWSVVQTLQHLNFSFISSINYLKKNYKAIYLNTIPLPAG